MVEKIVHTHLVKKQSPILAVCIYCNKPIPPNEMHYVEEGDTEHLHSLIARKFCVECYTKHGEQLLFQETLK